jgi:hypothetical protein
MSALALGLLLICMLGTGRCSEAAETNVETRQPPRFTEEREAAALFFVRKHVPDLPPLLEQLKSSNVSQYRHEIREIFQVTEWLADLQDDPRRYDLELKIWIAENKANILVAKMSTSTDDERKKIRAQLHELARELVDLDIQVLDLKAEQLKQELSQVEDELLKTRDQSDKKAVQRYEGFLDKADRRKK